MASQAAVAEPIASQRTRTGGPVADETATAIRRPRVTRPVDAIPGDAPYDPYGPHDAAATGGPAVVGARSHTRAVAGATAAGVGAGFHFLARLLLAVGVLIALLIGLAILLRDVGANPSNSVVSAIHDAANFFAGSFTGLVSEAGHPKRAITLNWGIAAGVYVIVAAVLAALIARVGRSAQRLDNRAAPRRLVVTH